MTRGRKAALGAVGVTLAAVLVLGLEAAYAAQRTYLTADSAPPDTASYGGSPAVAGKPVVRLVMLGDSTAAGVGATRTATTVGGQIGRASCRERV